MDSTVPTTCGMVFTTSACVAGIHMHHIGMDIGMPPGHVDLPRELQTLGKEMCMSYSHLTQTCEIGAIHLTVECTHLSTGPASATAWGVALFPASAPVILSSWLLCRLLHSCVVIYP